MMEMKMSREYKDRLFRLRFGRDVPVQCPEPNGA